LRVRRAKPYVCVDCDYAEHFRFQETKDIDAAAGMWLRCLAHSRAQEQDGIVKLAWLRRTFATTFERIDELVAVGLLKKREDGDYEIHAYAPRNQTRAMLEEDRTGSRQRMLAWRKEKVSASAVGDVTANERVTRTERTPNESVTGDASAAGGGESALTRVASKTSAASLEEARVSRASLDPPFSPASSSRHEVEEKSSSPERMEDELEPSRPISRNVVTPNKRVTSTERTANERVTSAFVPTSTSTSFSLSSDQDHVSEIEREGRVQRGEGARPLPASEKALAGPAWLAAFTEGISEVTKRPCTAGRVYLGTLERLVSHHAPIRDAPSACAWLRSEANAFARKWDGKNPPKGLTPDGLERWLNEGRQGPPTFGKERIQQLPPEEWHEDDFSDLGAEVLR
jgi:hypothetical protein